MLKERKGRISPAASAVPTSHGFPMPDYRGRSLGQVVSTEERVKTGRRRPIRVLDEDTGEEETRFVPIYEKQLRVHWAWDGARWITGEAWEELCQSGPGPKPGVKFPRSCQINSLGEPIIQRRPKVPDPK